MTEFTDFPPYANAISIDRNVWLAPWIPNRAAGTPLTIQYSFIDDLLSVPSVVRGTFVPLTEAQRTSLREDFAAWASVAGLTFREVPDTTQDGGIHVRLGRYETVPLSAYGDPRPGNSGGDIFYPYGSGRWDTGTNDPRPLLLFDKRIEGDFSSTHFNSLHKIGHVLGLNHPVDNSNPALRAPASLDNFDYSVMSVNYGDALYSYQFAYDAVSKTVQQNFKFVEPTAPMLLDIVGAQHQFGAPLHDPTTGDSVYTWGTSEPFLATIWDSSGTDSIDLSNQILPSTVDLRPGQFSSIGVRTIDDIVGSLPIQHRTYYAEFLSSLGQGLYRGHANLAIGYGVSIENAIGGEAGDVLAGNSIANSLKGNGGDDRITGAGGNDRIDGGSGRDTAVFTGPMAHYALTVNAASATATVADKTGADGTDTLVGVEAITFAGTTLDMSWFLKAATAPAAQFGALLEMYIAYFDRAPDAVGLDYWASRMVDGMTLQEIARSFFVQPETVAAYPSGQSDRAFITTIYDNVLGRAPDQAGLDYWLRELAGGGIARSDFLLAIINGAKATSGAAADAQLLANKKAVGAYYAITQGLSDTDAARAVMATVDGTAASVVTANRAIDGYAAAAALAGTSDFVVQLVGVQV